MSSEAFENYEEDLRSLTETIKVKIDEHIPDSVGEARKKLIRDAQRQIDEAQIILHSMETEARVAPGSYRINMSSKIRNGQREVERLQRELKKQSGTQRSNSFKTAPVNTAGFFSPSTMDEENFENSARSRLLEGSDILNRTGESLERTHRIAVETDEIGSGIIDDLSGQKDQLIRTRDRLENMDANISHSRKVIRSIGKRIITNKLLLLFIIFLELCVLGALVYIKFFAK